MITLLSRGERFNPNFFYELGFDVDNSLLVKTDKSTLYVRKMNLEFAKKHYKNVKILDNEIIHKLIKNKEVAIDFNNENAKFLDSIKKHAKKVHDIGEDYLVRRSFKNEKELSNIKKASKIAKEIIQNLTIKKGMSELDIDKQLRKATIDEGLDISFEPIVSTGKNSSYPHSVPTNKKIEEHVMVDFGVKYNHYCSDITECIFLNKKSKPFYYYELIKDAFYTIVDNIKDASFGQDMNTLYLSAFKKLKLPEMPHSIGHGLGIEVHEYPRLRKTSNDRIRGTVLTVEPAVYFSGKFGVRYERDIFVNKSGKAEII